MNTDQFQTDLLQSLGLSSESAGLVMEHIGQLNGQIDRLSGLLAEAQDHLLGNDPSLTFADRRDLHERIAKATGTNNPDESLCDSCSETFATERLTCSHDGQDLCPSCLSAIDYMNAVDDLFKTTYGIESGYSADEIAIYQDNADSPAEVVQHIGESRNLTPIKK